MVQQENKITALYCRLSQEDLVKGESVSISHQKQILLEYAEENGFTNIQVWSDDGYSGTSFDRPDWNKLNEEMEQGNIGTIIVKDHSRLGRDRLVMGYLLEEKFVDYGVRYIAINDGIDTKKGIDESLAIRDLFNEWHARDTSKKIKAVKMAAANRGERIGTKAPYGYKKDPNNSKKIIPNEDTSPIIKRIFALCASGLGPSKIARVLTEDKVLKPTVYEYQTNGTNHTFLNLSKPYDWSGKTISKILESEEYIGTTVNCRKYRVSFKNKKTRKNPPEKWIRFENTHEAIIDRETWDIVQKVRSTKRRPNKMGEQDILSGLVECKTCGSKHYLCRCGSWNKEQFTYTCGKYHNHKDECTPHTIKVVGLHQAVLSHLNFVISKAKNNKEEFLQNVMNEQSEQLKKDLSSKRRELDKSQKRLGEIDILFRKSFEKMALGEITDEQFKMLTGGYDNEKISLISKTQLLENEINTEQDKLLNTDRFMKCVDKYTDIKELTPEIVREFIDKIVVYERSEPWKKKNYTQDIDIYFNFIGKV